VNAKVVRHLGVVGVSSDPSATFGPGRPSGGNRCPDPDSAYSLEALLQAALSAPPERQAAALRLLRGELPKSEPSVTLRRLAQLVGFGVTTLRRWNVPWHDYGGARRYKVSEVEAYLKSEAFARRCASLRAERRAQVRAPDSRCNPSNVSLPPSSVRLLNLVQEKPEQPASQPRNGEHIHGDL